jgi:hypothetical protein
VEILIRLVKNYLSAMEHGRNEVGAAMSLEINVSATVTVAFALALTNPKVPGEVLLEHLTSERSNAASDCCLSGTAGWPNCSYKAVLYI